MTKISLKNHIKKIEWEAIFWLCGLIFLFFINPYKEQTYSFCPLHNLGISFCPGCGLGRSISFLYYFDFQNSLNTHPLGIIAFVIINYRIIVLLNKTIKNFTQMERKWQTYTN